MNLDPKHRIQTIEEFRALAEDPKKIIEHTNALANWCRYYLGINTMPAAWQVIDAEMKFIPCDPWKEYQTKPIPEELHKKWLKDGAFCSGIAGILGHVFHRPDRVGWYLSEVDMDNAVGILEFIKWKGDKSLADFGRRGLVTQHTAKPNSSAKAYIYSRTPLKNKDSDVSKDDTTLPSWEIRCLGRMAVMPGSRHKKGDPMIIIKDGNLEPFTLSDEMEQQVFEEYSNNLCIKHGLTPYLTTKNGGNGNTNSSNDNTTNNNGLRDAIPLDPQIAIMLSFQIGSYDEAIEINLHRRHKTMIKIADSILFRYSEDEHVNMESLRDWFILINEHCCKPPLGMVERDRIWNDAVEYVGRQKAIESKRILTVSEAIRERPGPNKTAVRGTIFAVSSIFKVAMRLDYRCLNCNVTNEGRVNHVTGTAYFASEDSKVVPKKCVNCGEKEFTRIDEHSVITDGKVVTLQNVDLSTDLDETLEIMLLGEHTKDVKAGEVVIIQGSIYYGQSNLSSRAKTRKTIALMTAKFVTYEGRQDNVITDRDVASFHKFATLNHANDVLDRLVFMTAPNVIGEEQYKLGVLRAIVGGSDWQKRGRIHTLSVGDKGLAKSLVMREAIRMKPNARLITAQSASSTSALGIVEATNDSKVLIYGPIPLSSGSLCGIDEIQTWTYDNQGALLNVMEEGKFNLLRYARDKSIVAETTIIAVANPQDIDYHKYRESISINEITLLRPLLDRFDQIYVALDKRDLNEDWDYSGKRLDYTRSRRPHNYNFILKYLAYAQGRKPALQPEAAITLRKFWVELRKHGLAGKRMLESIFRIAEATAKLRLKQVIDEDIAQEVQESIKLMLERQGELVRVVQDPRDVIIEGAKMVIENTQASIAFDEAVWLACKEYKYAGFWMYGGPNKELNTENNKRYREIYTRFLQEIRKPNSKIAIIKKTPLVVRWQTAKADTTTVTGTTINENDHNDQNDLNHGVGDQKSTSNNGDKTIESPKQDSTFSVAEKESGSFRSFRSFSQDPIKDNPQDPLNDYPEYEYLEPVKAYRCLECRGIFSVNTKDSKDAHPCNSRLEGSVGY